MNKRELTKSFWVDEADRTGQVRLELPLRLFGSIERRPKPVEQSAPTNGKNVVSQFWWGGEENAAPADALSPLPTSEILPRIEDLYYLRMRAISQRIIEGYWLDYTRPGVLEDSVALLDGQRLCTDHDYWNVRDAIGAIVATEWDAKGENSNNYPGINARFFVDAKRAPEIVRMLAWPVPGIHSCSVTVGFEWEPSHPDLMEDGDFWRLRGREVEGQIVRMIVTRILFYRELSLVYEGADADARRLPDETDEESGRKKTKMNSAEPTALTGASTKENTVKLSKEQKELLGLSHAGDDVPDAEVVSALDGLVKAQAAQTATLAAANQIIETERAEVIRLATLAEAGEDGQLPTVLAASIEHTPADKLKDMKAYYEQRAAARLGVKNGTGRSSVEDNPITAQQQPKAAIDTVNYL